MLGGPERKDNSDHAKAMPKTKAKVHSALCPDCWGSGKEHVAVNDRLQAAVILLKYDIPDVHLHKVAAILANIARDTLQCGVCNGAGQTQFQAPGDGVVRTCQNCNGSGKEPVTIALRVAALEALAQFPALHQYTRIAADSLIDSNVATLRMAGSEVLQRLA